MDDERRLADLVDVGDGEAAVGGADDPALAVGAEPDRLAVLEADLVRGAALAADRVEGAVVEDVAVLVDLDEGGAIVLGGGAQGRGEVLLLDVDGAGDERGLGAERQRQRVERRVLGAERGRLRDLALLAGRRVLALGQAVDLVVEEQDLDRHVPPQRVDQVVAADRERVAVAGHDPDREVLARGGDPGRDRRGAAVDAVHPVGVHVVDEAPGAADPGDEDGALGRDPQFGHQRLDAGEDRVVAATRGTSAFPGRTGSRPWPASAGRCRCRRRWLRCAVLAHDSASRIACSISSARIGRPSILL